MSRERSVPFFPLYCTTHAKTSVRIITAFNRNLIVQQHSQNTPLAPLTPYFCLCLKSRCCHSRCVVNISLPTNHNRIRTRWLFQVKLNGKLGTVMQKPTIFWNYISREMVFEAIQGNTFQGICMWQHRRPSLRKMISRIVVLSGARKFYIKN